MFSRDSVLGLEHAEGHIGFLALPGGVLPALCQFEKSKLLDKVGCSPALLGQTAPQLPHHEQQLAPLLEQGLERPGG